MVLAYCVSTTSLLLISMIVSQELKKKLERMKNLDIRPERSYDNGN
jgi:hypothetical protein